MFILLASSVEAGSSKKIFTATVPMSSNYAKIGDVCVSFNASMNSPWFGGLQRVETESGVTFRHSKNIESTYPKVIDLQVWARPYLCNSWKMRSKDLGVKAIESLSFNCFSNRRGDLQPLGTLSTFKKRFAKTGQWLFIIQVETTNIPLEDHIVLTVLDEDKKELARISGQL